MVAAKPFADYDAKFQASDQESKNFIRVVYHSLADKPAPRPPRWAAPRRIEGSFRAPLPPPHGRGSSRPTSGQPVTDEFGD